MSTPSSGPQADPGSLESSGSSMATVAAGNEQEPEDHPAYLEAASQLEAFLAEQGMPTDAAASAVSTSRASSST